MRARSDRTDGPLKVQALYSLATLARVAGVTPQLLMRLLRTNEVQLVSAGRSVLVPLSEIQRLIPALWHSLNAIERMRADAQQRASTGPESDTE
jgi:hypothetical protein